VHGRTVLQRYKGDSSREFLARVKEHAGDRTIIASGDLYTAQDCVDVLRETSVDGVAAARGAIGNPWIFEQFRDLVEGREPSHPTIAQQREVLREHFRLAESLYGESRAGRTLRKCAIRYARLHPDSERVRCDFIEVKSRAEWDAVLEKWYGEEVASG